jgi:hypothetical protein
MINNGHIGHRCLRNLKRKANETKNNPNNPAAGISGGVCVNHLWPVVAGGGGMKDEAPVQEPVWIQPDHLQKAQKAPFLCRVEPHKRDDFVPLYTAPPAQPAPVQPVKPSLWEQYHAAQPAPVQEPVAWMAESKNGNVRFTNIGQSADQLESFGWTIFPLCVAPFQFQPLTEEAVLECWKQVYEPGRREHDNATRMARAIEAAHGITKGQS